MAIFFVSITASSTAGNVKIDILDADGKVVVSGEGTDVHLDMPFTSLRNNKELAKRRRLEQKFIFRKVDRVFPLIYNDYWIKVV